MKTYETCKTASNFEKDSSPSAWKHEKERWLKSEVTAPQEVALRMAAVSAHRQDQFPDQVRMSF